MVKVCAGCGVEKPLVDFSVRSFRGRKYPVSRCKPCCAEREKAKRHSDLEANREYKRQHYAKNIEAGRKTARESRKRHAELRNKYAADWRKKNADLVEKYRLKYRKNNKSKFTLYASMRRAALVNACPKWADRKAIEIVYKEAAENGLHVDHIVPLRSKLVCGLHVAWNLRPLDAKENASKGNRRWPDMP